MSNERVLQLSYFVVLLGSTSLGLLTYGLLRRSFRGVCDETRSRIAVFARRFFLFGIATPALLGFCSVSYFTCNVSTYEGVIEHRDHLFAISCSQMHAALLYTVIAVLLWCLVVFSILLTGLKRAQ